MCVGGGEPRPEIIVVGVVVVVVVVVIVLVVLVAVVVLLRVPSAVRYDATIGTRKWLF